MNRYIVSPAARRDMQEAARNGATKFGRERTYFAELDRVMELIAEFPLMAHERAEFSPPVRIHHHGRHYIVYRALKSHVRILRVLRDEIDLHRHFRGAD